MTDLSTLANGLFGVDDAGLTAATCTIPHNKPTMYSLAVELAVERRIPAVALLAIYTA
jgi:hypothetical protein